jgi:hypothetical protein
MFGKPPSRLRPDVRMQDKGPHRGPLAFIGCDPFTDFGKEIVLILFGKVGFQSSPSYRLIGAPGMMVEIACL